MQFILSSVIITPPGNQAYKLWNPLIEPESVDFVTPQEYPVMPGAAWVEAWTLQTAAAPKCALVHQEACAVNTPLIVPAWNQLLLHHQDRRLVQFFLQGVSEGFRIGFSSPLWKLRSARRNMPSALDHPEVVDQYLSIEVNERRVAGPFPSQACVGHVSRFGIIPKSHQPNKWRLIFDLSHPKGHSVNDGIPKELCSISYITAIRKIVQLGPQSLLAKIDIKSAFRLIPVHPADRHLLAMSWKGSLYIDMCLPFGLRSAPRLFNTLADLLAWILKDRGVTFILHYLDDFLTMGPPGSADCEHNLQLIKEICHFLGIPLALEKVEGPSPTLDFLGITLDTSRMEARLPEEKLQRVRVAVHEWIHKKSATKREILSLVGSLQHATKVVRAGRSFLSRMYSAAAKVPELNYYTRLNKDFRSDLAWWHTFLADWNGVSFFQVVEALPPPSLTIQTDASGGWGCGGYFEGNWIQWQWPHDWMPIPIMAKELVPIILCCAVWGVQMRRKVVLFQCDNNAVVAAVKKGSSKDPLVMHLLRALWFFVAHFDIALTIEHLSGVCNTNADQLSRNNLHPFFLANPQANPQPSPLPQELLQVVAVHGPDWTSPAFRKLFRDITSRASLHQP